MGADTNDHLCQTELIVSYLDSELDEASRTAIEQHMNECELCASEMNRQRRLLLVLDSALSDRFALPLPRNFAEVVAARAESDVSRVRTRSEHRIALRVCALLAVTSFSLLGAAANNLVFAMARSTARTCLGLLGFLARMLYDAVTGLVVISRVINRKLVLESHAFGLLSLLLLALAVVLLSRLISSYHRTRLVE
jgi:anti-sigma factor RsiW